MRVKILPLLVALLLLPVSAASGETLMRVFRAEDMTEPSRWSAAADPSDEVTITLTFAGDCTLGTMPTIRGHRNSFDAYVKNNGMAYPFAGQQALFSTDDFTLINLEGVLSDSTKGKVKKKFNFIGDTAYTAVLTEGSVECVNLANNHAKDFGARGYQSTLDALNAAGVGYVDEDWLCILEKDGVRIGLTATLFNMRDNKKREFKEQIELLKELGCSVIIHSMHAGKEYLNRANSQQVTIAETAVEYGAALVVGHHPHVVQGVELMGQTPVIYSLGNNSFGGNFNPSDYDAMLLRVEFKFVKGKPTSLDWSLYPISISGEKRYNDYQPVLLTGEEARRVMERVNDMSKTELLPFEEAVGARQATIQYE